MASLHTIRIQTASPSKSGQVLLPRQRMKDLGLSGGRCLLAFGGKQVPVFVAEGRDDRLSVAPDIAAALLLPSTLNLPLTYTGNTLRIGYVLGVLANVLVEKGQVGGQQRLVFRNLLQTAREQGMYGYVFSPLDMDWEAQTTSAYVYTGRSWRRVKVPLPDVVYDQIVSRAFENRPDVAEQRGRLIKLLQARYFNRGFFDKWQVHQWLAAHSRTKEHVPETIQYENMERAAEFLYQHPDVYMKPVHGSLGIGILRLRRKADGRVHYSLKKKDGSLLHGQAGSISQFLKLHQKRLKRGPYLLQKTLQLRTRHGRPFDIRLLLQKDGTGRWNRTKAFCRIAQEGQITSNLSTGGDALAVKQVLKEILANDKRVNKIMRALKQIAEDVPAVLEAAVEGTLGEIGLDLGLDDAGHLWVIEVNARPWKKPNIAEGEWKELALLAFQRPVHYALYLCKMHRDS